MARHAAPESPAVIEPVDTPLNTPVLIVVGMLCVTAIITVMIIAGAAEVLGQIASAAFLTWAGIMWLRIRRGNT